MSHDNSAQSYGFRQVAPKNPHVLIVDGNWDEGLHDGVDSLYPSVKAGVQDVREWAESKEPLILPGQTAVIYRLVPVARVEVAEVARRAAVTVKALNG